MTQPTPATGTTRTARQGYGYWDLTHYPHGGCFRRLTADTLVTLEGKRIKGDEVVRTSDGVRIAITPSAFKPEAA